jgi:hypothetical protein
MKKILFILFPLFVILNVQAQSCNELIEFVKSKDYGITYRSYNSEAISKVTFYSVYMDYTTYYYAIVCFKPNKYAYNCTEYIYQVASNTKSNYSLDYYDSAGQAFWKHIQPYADVLGCSPNFN